MGGSPRNICVYLQLLPFHQGHITKKYNENIKTVLVSMSLEQGSIQLSVREACVGIYRLRVR